MVFSEECFTSSMHMSVVHVVTEESDGSPRAKVVGVHEPPPDMFV